MGRREEILDVAADLFAQKGFHGVSVSELGAACGFSGPALYRHFRSKDAILADEGPTAGPASLVGLGIARLKQLRGEHQWVVTPRTAPSAGSSSSRPTTRQHDDTTDPSDAREMEVAA